MNNPKVNALQDIVELLEATSIEELAKNDVEVFLDAQKLIIKKLDEAAELIKTREIERFAPISRRLGITAQDWVKELGSEASELGYSFLPTPEQTQQSRTASPKARRKLPPKYRSPDGKEWGGRGSHPKWMSENKKRQGNEEYERNEQLYRIGDDGKTQYERDQEKKSALTTQEDAFKQGPTSQG